MTTLSDILRGAYDMLGLVKTYQATGGSTTTAVVSTFSDAETPPEDDFSVGWTMFVDRAGGAAPEGEYQRITDYAAGTYTFTFAAMTAAVESGDRLMAARPTVPLQQMIRSVNTALSEIETIPLIDSSITLTEDEQDYSLPAGVYSILEFDYVDSSGDRHKMTGYRVVPHATATGVLSVHIDKPPAGTAYITYEGVHSVVSAYNDTISPTIPKQLLVAQTAHCALRYVSQQSPLWQEKYQVVVGELNAARQIKRNKKPIKRHPILDLRNA